MKSKTAKQLHRVVEVRWSVYYQSMIRVTKLYSGRTLVCFNVELIEGEKEDGKA